MTEDKTASSDSKQWTWTVTFLANVNKIPYRQSLANVTKYQLGDFKQKNQENK